VLDLVNILFGKGTGLCFDCAGMKSPRPKAKEKRDPSPPIAQEGPTLVSPAQPVRKDKWDHLPWVLLVVVILFAAYVRFRLREFPLERDEGEYAYAGQLILQGISPYKLAYTMKLPGTAAMYALIMVVFGQTASGIHIGLLVVNAVSIVLLFLLARRLFDSTAGVVAAACYAVFSANSTVLGTAAHATHFVVLYALGGTLLLVDALSRGRSLLFFASGLFFGLAFLMKQQGVFFSFFGLSWIVLAEWKRSPWRRIAQHTGLYSAGLIAPFLLVCLAVTLAGDFKTFWFWTFQYAREYVSGASFSNGEKALWIQLLAMARPHWPIALLAVAGSILLWRKKPAHEHRLFAIAFFLYSALTVFPGFYFRHHYFITVLPAFTLLAGAGTSLLRQRLTDAEVPAWWRQVPWFLATVAVAFAVWMQSNLYFRIDPMTACHVIYADCGFVESLEVGRYLREHSKPDARVAVLGSDPQIYFYSQRRSATGFIYVFGLLEDQPFARQMQKQMIDEIERTAPEYLVFVNLPLSWAVGPHSSMDIFKWINSYQANYESVGVIDMIAPGQAKILWNQATSGYALRSGKFILVMKRKAKA
jgi:hypothetical protein